MSKNALHIVLKIVVNICRFLLAATFLFSGFVKANDPLGMVYKLEDYFSAWGITGVPGLFTLLMAMGIALFEFVLGVYLEMGVAHHIGLHGVHDPTDCVYCNSEPCERLWLFWRCHHPDKHTDAAEEYRVAGSSDCGIPMVSAPTTSYQYKGILDHIYIVHAGIDGIYDVLHLCIASHRLPSLQGGN